MRDDLKQREAELEKSLDDKQQLKNQVQTLKEGLQNLKNTHRLQVSFRGAREGIFHSSLLGGWVREEHYLICTLIRKNWVWDDFQRTQDIEAIYHQ